MVTLTYCRLWYDISIQAGNLYYIRHIQVLKIANAEQTNLNAIDGTMVERKLSVCMSKLNQHERKGYTGSAVDSNSLQHTWVMVAHTSCGVFHTADVIGCRNEFKPT